MEGPERETMEVDVLFVGGGPAGLAGSIHLARLVAEHDQAAPPDRRIGEVSILLLEKGAHFGAHGFSGAVMDPKAIRELLPDYRLPDHATEVKGEGIYLLTGRRCIRAPFTPPSLSNHGYQILSLAKLLRDLAQEAEKRGVQAFAGFPADRLLLEEGRVAGVVTRDTGIDKHGKRKASFQPGMEIRARATVLCEGVRGTLTEGLKREFDLMDGREPDCYATGVKEIWRVRPDRHEEGRVLHTLGWPLLGRKGVVGGGWVYHMKDGLVSVGHVVRLDYEDPLLDPFDEFQKYKEHPMLARLLEGGELVDYGAKAISEGGYWAIPKLACPGALIAGEAANLLNAFKLKGIHLAIKSGILAAETLFECLLSRDFSPERLQRYEEKVRASTIGKELHGARNFHHALSSGMFLGMARVAFQLATGGYDILGDRLPGRPDHTTYRRVEELHGRPYSDIKKELQTRASGRYDKKLTFDRMTDIYRCGTMHDEDQPAHLKVLDTDLCVSRCAQEYGNPCTRFCPAGVYEMVDDPGTGKERLQVNFSNCVHCKTCDIADPYRNITWTLPEGGGGPKYTWT